MGNQIFIHITLALAVGGGRDIIKNCLQGVLVFVVGTRSVLVVKL